MEHLLRRRFRFLCGREDGADEEFSSAHDHLTAQLHNPQYIDGTPRVILEVLNDLLPSGQAMQLADAFDTDGMTDENIANSPYKWMGYSLLVTFLISILGIILFRKKDIR